MKNIFAPIFLLVFICYIISCNSGQSAIQLQQKRAAVLNADTSKFATAMVDNKRDPSCGMPLTAGIGDTAHYKNKVIGFCSKECKDEFLKDPAKNITAADMKK